MQNARMQEAGGRRQEAGGCAYPNVGGGPVVGLPEEHLRRGVRRRAAEGAQALALRAERAEPEVCARTQLYLLRVTHFH